MGIKKKIFLGWVAFEAISLCIALPAAAQIVDRVVFSAAPRAAHVVTALTPGLTEIIVASNAPFTVLSEGAVGEMSMVLTVSGTVNGTAFGAQAQHPGLIQGCVMPTNSSLTSLYTATRRTAANRGEVISQAVMIHIKYDPALTPTFVVKTLDQLEAKSAATAVTCNPLSS